MGAPLRGDERIRLQGVVPGADPRHTVTWQLPGGGPQATLRRPGRGRRVPVCQTAAQANADLPCLRPLGEETARPAVALMRVRRVPLAGRERGTGADALGRAAVIRAGTVRGVEGGATGLRFGTPDEARNSRHSVAWRVQCVAPGQSPQCAVGAAAGGVGLLLLVHGPAQAAAAGAGVRSVPQAGRRATCPGVWPRGAAPLPERLHGRQPGAGRASSTGRVFQLGVDQPAGQPGRAHGGLSLLGSADGHAQVAAADPRPGRVGGAAAHRDHALQRRCA